MEEPGEVARNFGLSFSLNFLSILLHISGSLGLITLSWASLERSFPPAEVEYREMPIDQFRYIKIQPKTVDLSTRLWGINTEFVGFIPQSLVLRSIF